MAPSRALVALLAVSVLLQYAAASSQMTISPNLRPTSRPLVNKEDNVGPVLDEKSISLRRTAVGFEPEQVHLTYWGSPDKMAVSFASSAGMVVMGEPKPLPRATAAAFVQWGASPKALDRNATCATVSYVQNQYAYDKSPGYVSPYLSHCLMTDLPAGKRTFYRVGWPAFNEWSPVRGFMTFKAEANFPLRVGVMADLGLSVNATQTASRMFGAKPQVILNIGDLPYADNFLPDGRSGTVKGLKYFLSYQPRWDMYGRMLEKVASEVPIMTSTGNHEIEFQADGTVFAAYTNRYPVPKDPSKPPQPVTNVFTKDNPSPDAGLYYSWDVPGVAHFVALTSYITNDTFTRDTAQYQWLMRDLAKVDRKKTPWLIAYFHAPIVTSYEASFKQVECMRLTYEPLLYRYGADLVLNGHVHAYERSKPVFNYTLDACGPIHITIGCGGKPGEAGSGIDALDNSYIEGGSFFCKDPYVLNARPNPTQPLRCYTWQPELGGFCWDEQPPFSAYRETAFGHGMLTLLNATNAIWSWDQNNEKEGFEDYVLLNRGEPGDCFERRARKLEGYKF